MDGPPTRSRENMTLIMDDLKRSLDSRSKDKSGNRLHPLTRWIPLNYLSAYMAQLEAHVDLFDFPLPLISV